MVDCELDRTSDCYNLCSLRSASDKSSGIMGQIISCLRRNQSDDNEEENYNAMNHIEQEQRGDVAKPIIKNLHSRTFEDVTQEFSENMREHKERDNCDGFRFHKDNFCHKCTLIAIKADLENGDCQPGGPYGFTQLGFVENFSMKTYYDAKNPTPHISPYCPKHLPTLRNRRQRYNRCNNGSPLCFGNVTRGSIKRITRAYSW